MSATARFLLQCLTLPGVLAGLHSLRRAAGQGCQQMSWSTPGAPAPPPCARPLTSWSPAVRAPRAPRCEKALRPGLCPGVSRAPHQVQQCGVRIFLCVECMKTGGARAELCAHATADLRTAQHEGHQSRCAVTGPARQHGLPSCMLHCRRCTLGECSRPEVRLQRPPVPF